MKIARWCFERRKLVVITWVVGFLAVSVVAFGIVGADNRQEFEAPESESGAGFEIVQDHFGDIGFSQGSIVVQAEQGIDAPEVRAAFESLMAKAESYDGLWVTSPYSAEGRHQIVPFGPHANQIAFAAVQVSNDLSWTDSGVIGKELLAEIEVLEAEIDGFRAEVGGQMFAEFEPPLAEIIGLAFAIVVLIVSFGSVLAMGLPVAVALGGVGFGLAFAALVSNLMAVPEFATVIGAMIGIGVGIDYALFVVTRYREALHSGFRPGVANAAAADTAGRAVVFAGLTVVVSLLGLLLIGLEFVAGLGVTAAIVVAMTVVATTTLLPALLGFSELRIELTRWRGLIAAGFVAVALLSVGLQAPPQFTTLPAMAIAVVVLVVGSFAPMLKREVPRRQPKALSDTIWYRWSHMIQDRPWPFLLLGVVVLLFLATPVLGLRLGFSDDGNFSTDTTTRQAYDLLAEGFGPGFNGPFIGVAELGPGEDAGQLEEMTAAIRADRGVFFVTPVELSPEGSAAHFLIIPSTSPQDIETERTINRLRSEVIPAAASGTGVDVLITGFVPMSMDFSSYLGERTVLFFGLVLTLSFLLLMAVFRSVLVPLKAVLMNLLSIAAAYGVVVALFQWGHLSFITGIEPGPIEPFIPMMMFAIVFGLSMDYEVFILSRIKEKFERTGDTKDSVADGLAATARVITAAAAIMIVVFGSFILEDDRVPKLMGVGLAVAVFLDATLVRMLLVPATMALLGERNWWFPKWLDRIVPALHVEGAPDHDSQLAAFAAELEEIEARVRSDEPPEAEPRTPVGVGD